MAFPIFVQKKFGSYLGKRAANALVNRIPGQKTLTRAEKASEFFKKHGDRIAQGLDRLASFGVNDEVDLGGAEAPSGLISQTLSSGLDLARSGVRAAASGVRALGQFSADHLQQLDIADDFLFDQVLPGIPETGAINVDEVAGRLGNVIRDNPEFINSFKQSFSETLKERGRGVLQSVKNIASNTREGAKKAKQQLQQSTVEEIDPEREARLTRETQAKAKARKAADRARERKRSLERVQREAYQQTPTTQFLRDMRSDIREDDNTPVPFQSSARATSSSASESPEEEATETTPLIPVEQPVASEPTVFHAVPSTIPQPTFLNPVSSATSSSSSSTTSMSSADATPEVPHVATPPVFHGPATADRITSVTSDPERTYYPAPSAHRGYQGMSELEEGGAFGSADNTLFDDAFESENVHELDTTINANLRRTRSEGNGFFGNLFRRGRDVIMRTGNDFEAPASVRERLAGYQPPVGPVNTSNLAAEGVGAAAESPSIGNRIFNTFRNLFGGNNNAGAEAQPNGMRGFFGVMMMQQAQQGISQMLQQASQDALNDANASRNIFNLQNQASEAMYNSSLNNAQRIEQEKNNRLQSRRGIYNW